MEKKKPQINLTNILSFIEGNTQLALESIYMQPQHIREQIAYRRLICKDDCAIEGKCIKCGCEFNGKTSVEKSCNPDRFPDLKGRIDWEKFKEEHDIK